MTSEERKITVETDSGDSVDFYVLEETMVGGMSYLLVTDAKEDEDGECYIFKDLSAADDEEAAYVPVEGDDELDYMYRIFSELLEDTGVKIEK